MGYNKEVAKLIHDIENFRPFFDNILNNKPVHLDGNFKNLIVPLYDSLFIVQRKEKIKKVPTSLSDFPIAYATLAEAVNRLIDKVEKKGKEDGN